MVVHVRESGGGPEDALILLDGSQVGRGSDLRIPTEPGQHEVEADADCGSDHARVDVPEGTWEDVYLRPCGGGGFSCTRSWVTPAGGVTKGTT